MSMIVYVFMVAAGLLGCSFLAYGITCAVRDRQRADRAALKRAATEWAGEEAPAGRTR